MMDFIESQIIFFTKRKKLFSFQGKCSIDYLIALDNDGIVVIISREQQIHKEVRLKQNLLESHVERETYRIRYISKGISFLASSSISESRRRACLKSFAPLIDRSEAPD